MRLGDRLEGSFSFNGSCRDTVDHGSMDIELRLGDGGGLSEAASGGMVKGVPIIVFHYDLRSFLRYECGDCKKVCLRIHNNNLVLLI